MSWDKWGNHILIELKRLNLNVTKIEVLIHKEHKKIAKDITALKVKAGIWGAVAALVISLMPDVVKWLSV